MEEITTAVQQVAKDLFKVDCQVELTVPDEQFGDYSTNVALQLAGQLQRPPRQLAEELSAKLSEQLGQQVKAVTVAGPGFINLSLSDRLISDLASQATTSRPQNYAGQKIVAEYSDPNPFKVLHAGHLYTTLVGDAIARLIEVSGGEVHRTNFGGDVGRHVAISMWSIVDFLGGEFPEKLNEIPAAERSHWLSARYVEGNTAFENDPAAKAAITEMNKRVYQIHTDNDHESAFAQIYWTCRQWSYDYFAWLYEQLEVTPFEKYYPESQTSQLGIDTVSEQLARGVYEKSDGAIVFRGEPYGLHTRVFINQQGLPTYEAKDVGLIMAKWRDYHFDQSVIITGNDIVEYMKVVLKSIEQYAPELAQRSRHLTHGMVKLSGGRKMSSRTGNGLLATDVLDAATNAQKEKMGQENRQIMLGAVKYSLLKQRLGGDIIYEPEESVSLEGNSGPYLQYAHARARSILVKSAKGATDSIDQQLEPDERRLLRKIGQYAGAVEKAAAELMPHHICTYLYELAQEFNRFYENNRVVGHDREALRLKIVLLYADILKDGLKLLGISALDKM